MSIDDQKWNKDMPNWDPKVASKFIQSEIEGGMELEKIPLGKSILLKTQNTNYIIERRTDGFYISGNPEFCAKPRKVNIGGSTFGGNLIKTGYLGRGMNLEMSFPDEKISDQGP